MLERIHRILVKEFIQVLRDPRMRGVIFALPVIQLLVFSYAVTTDVRHIATGVYDLDNTPSSRDLAARFAGSGYFDVRECVYDDRRAAHLLDRGAVRVILRMNKGFGSDLRAGRTAQLQILVDGADSNTASIVLGYAARVTERFSREMLDARARRLLGGPIQARGVDIRTRAWFNPNLESRNYFVPGLVVLIVTLVSLMLTGMAVVREKEIGTMEQIMVTPIRPVEFILGKTVPFALIGYLDALVVTAVAVFWFEIPLRGSLVLLFVCITIYLMTTLGVGLLISTLSQTQQQAMMTTFFFFLPAILLSGFMFPIANMPPVVQALTYLNPMRYFLEIVRGIFLKGTGVGVLWRQIVPMAVIGAAALWLSARRFHKTLA